MSFQISEQQFRVHTQYMQERFTKLELMDFNYNVIDELSGVTISGSITVDANSSLRRTGNIKLVVENSTFEVGSGGAIWLDRYVKVSVGTRDILTDEIVWTVMGVFLIDAPSYTYNATTNELTLTLLDLMSKMTGARNGNLPGIPVLLSRDENIRTAIIETLTELGGFSKYVVDEAPDPSVIPNDLTFPQGSTVYDLLSELAAIYPTYEIFFDTEGVFYYKPIPNGVGNPIIADDSLWNEVIDEEVVEVNFQDVKNSIEVYGRTHEPNRFSTATTVSGSNITMTIASATSYVENFIYGFTLANSTEITNPQIRIGTLSYQSVYLDSGEDLVIPATDEEVYWCVYYDGTAFRWLGHLQAYGSSEDENPDSPFYVGSDIGVIRLPLFDGDYANCYTDELAQERADYELWLHTSMQDSVTISGVPVYWLDVNYLVEYSPRGGDEVYQYIIKSINFGLSPSDKMTINMIRFYEDYPII